MIPMRSATISSSAAFAPSSCRNQTAPRRSATTSGFTLSATPQACHPSKPYRGAAVVDLTPDPSRSARARRNLLCMGLFFQKIECRAARPLLVNGIEDVISRADLADRGIFLPLAPIGERQRHSQAELWREFEIARPRLLGALLDAAVHGLQTLPGVALRSLPRMADFALWATACETALCPAGTFARAYGANRRTAIEAMIDADPVAACVREIMAERSSWTGSAADLLRAGAARSADGIYRNSTGWPKNPRALAGCLRRAQTFLPALGLHV